MIAQAHLLQGGKRLHLHHGPIDLIIGVDGPLRMACFKHATRRFQTILQGLADELVDLRKPIQGTVFHDPVARRMAQAVGAYKNTFVTPMAAVAGAVADEVLAAMVAHGSPTKAYVNNGGDIAFYLSAGQQIASRGPGGDITLTAQDTARGLATSGWQGRSHSRGIADAVTVAAPTAAAADVAATLIANAVDLPQSTAIKRTPANRLNPDSDLGARLVTTHVPRLSLEEIETALMRGAALAQKLVTDRLICQASLTLQGRTHVQSPSERHSKGTLANA
jgi:ApbE superfamily uncharacterized protein (UPF0280 family)